MRGRKFSNALSTASLNSHMLPKCFGFFDDIMRAIEPGELHSGDRLQGVQNFVMSCHLAWLPAKKFSPT